MKKYFLINMFNFYRLPKPQYLSSLKRTQKNVKKLSDTLKWGTFFLYCLSVLLSSGSGTFTWTAVFTRLMKEIRTEKLRTARNDYYEGKLLLDKLLTYQGGWRPPFLYC